MPDPGEAIAEYGRGQQQPPFATADGIGQQGNHQAGADKVQAAAGGVAVLPQVVRIELGKTAKMRCAVHGSAPGLTLLDKIYGVEPDSSLE
ncbi:hypothetical protein D9M71_612230 [compost metagenome]